MSRLIRQLREERARTWEKAKAHLDAHEHNFTAEAEAEYKRYNDEIDTLDARIRELEDDEARNAVAESMRARYERFTPPSSSSGIGRLEPQLAEFISGRAVALDVDFRGLERHVNRHGVVEVRDLLKGTATAGGNTVPTSFRTQLMEHLIESSGVRQTNVLVITTDSGEDLQIPKTTAHSTAAITAEGGALNESDPAFGQTTLSSFKYSVMVQVTRELLEDSGVDLLGYLARETGRALGNKSGEHYVTGTGTAQPTGVVTASTAGVTGGTGVNGAFTADNLVDLFYSVIPEYRRRGYWLMSDAAVAKARKLKDADNQYLWQPGMVSGEPDRLFGRPVVTDPNVPAPGLSAKSVVFGDFSTYAIRDVRGVRFERSDDFAFANDLVTFRAILRTDGDLVDLTGAIKHFVGAAT